MEWRREWKKLAILAAGFLLCFWLPVEELRGSARLGKAFWEALHLVRWYAREHVLLCLVPAFFIAGAMAVFLGQGAVMRWLGPRANKLLAYGVASVSGTILAVCSCTVLPLFAGIYRMGAGLGPATTFLYAGPAINVLAIILTARVLGLELGVARALGAVFFSLVIGLLMHLLCREGGKEREGPAPVMPAAGGERPLWHTALFFSALVGILVFANWGRPAAETGFWYQVYASRWAVTALFALGLAAMVILWLRVAWWRAALVIAAATVGAFLGAGPLVPFGIALVGLAWLTAADPGEGGEWFTRSWEFAKQILPLLLAGVLVAGFLLGRPGREGLIPAAWVESAVGGNSLAATFCAALAGAFMYFATLTEVPILQGLVGAGMGKGPALALLLAGPALSLPNMLVIRSVIGTGKTALFVGLVVVMSTAAGVVYGNLF